MIRVAQTAEQDQPLGVEYLAQDVGAIGEVGTSWSRAALEGALEAAGFSQIRWVMPELSPEGARQPNRQWWQDYVDQPFAVLLECTKD